MKSNEIDNRIQEIETAMYEADFWSDKAKAQAMLRELEDLKNKKEGASAFDKGDAVLTILSGAGGDDAEDFSRMLFEMYTRFCDKQNLSLDWWRCGSGSGAAKPRTTSGPCPNDWASPPGDGLDEWKEC